MENESTFSVKLCPDSQDVVGTNVRKVQYLLRERGYNLVPDGFYGLRTEGRIREFQAQAGLRIDGVVGARTWAALILDVRPGDRGDAVRAVQIQFASLKRDGIFGPRTLSRVRRFQLDRGLEPDGTVRPRTWSALAASPTFDLDNPWRDELAGGLYGGVGQKQPLLADVAEPDRRLSLLSGTGQRRNDP
jgi:peptidoglycan hydrolase-like protein with peptidoglycan-binding domain